MRKSKFAKDLSVLHETEETRSQHAKPRAILKDYSLNHRVEMQWDLNKEAIRDSIFRLRVDDYEVLLDWEEMMKAGRFV